MARDTRGRVPGETDDLERVSLNPSHWRSGRAFLLAQAVLIGILGVTVLAWAIVCPSTQPARIPLVGLRFSILQGALLLGYGALASLASLSRRAALWFASLAASLWFAMIIACAVGALHDAPGPLGLDLRDLLLYAVLAGYNIGLLIWLSGDAIAGPAWLPRRRSRKD